MPCTRANRNHPSPQNNPNPIPINPIVVEGIVSKRVLSAMANYEINRNMGPGGGIGWESSQGYNRGPPMTCTYNDFMNCKAEILL